MSNAKEQGEIIQYVPFSSFVHPSFWHRLSEKKVDIDKLKETNKQIYGRYTCNDDVGTVFEVEGTSFNINPQADLFYTNVKGTVMNKNTIEEFKTIDKASLLNSVGEIIWANLKLKTWIKTPGSLLNFFILSFADIKKFHYYYWCAFPAPSQPTLYLKEKTSSVTAHFTYKQLTKIETKHGELDESQKCFFVVTKDNENVEVETLANIFKKDIDTVNTYFGFCDPSNGVNPGWPLRIFLAALIDHCPDLINSDVKVLGLRSNYTGNMENSKVFIVNVPQDVKPVESAGWVGWERNEKGKFGPRLANMSSSMNPFDLADTSSDLNIRLMKWRLVPDINVDVMKSVKCLLLGAGTLGCHVARGLLAWGFRNITFIDNGRVSYSNPTRQVLFNHSDCLDGGRMKAEAAAKNLELIFPPVKARGIVAHIPMPGHTVGASLLQETIDNIKVLTDAIAEHDVIFLLLDTREARWMPTLIAALHGKLVINAALGFDSYLVMRHGVGESGKSDLTPQTPFLDGGDLGCYFCNDVTAPGNSLKDRTLDQQCTVTRPGVAATAGALAAELLVGLLQHPLRGKAPAMYNANAQEPPQLRGVLGPVPHTIRGFLDSYETLSPTCAKFAQCIACSDIVKDTYRAEGLDFLLKVCNSGTYLEEVTGLVELQLTAEMTDILTLSDEEDEG